MNYSLQQHKEGVDSTLVEHILILRRQEESTYKCFNYLDRDFQHKQAREEATSNFLGSPISPDESFMNESWREKICEWTYKIIDYFQYDRELAFICMNYLDRYAMTRRVNTKIYQLAAITSLFLTIKIHEPRSSHQRYQLDISSLVRLSQSVFNEASILAMEREMLQMLNWHLFPPTSGTFAQYLFQIFNSIKKNHSSTFQEFTERSLEEIKEREAVRALPV